jgi:hypothetical protein
MKPTNLITITALLLIFVAFTGCENSILPEVNSGTNEFEKEIAELQNAAKPALQSTPPSPLVTVSAGGPTLQFWPYTGTDFSGQPQDPINLIFIGEADPRDIRSALFSLDGDRAAAGFPPMPPFNSTWDDAIGDVQTGYGDPKGWVGGVVQLACGDYQDLRFHVRLFRIGEWTVGNAHFETIIPGTTDHQVLSWELAEQFVVYDFMRSGLLDPDVPMIPAGQINEAPFGGIPGMIYNEFPVPLRQLIGGPIEDIDEEDVVPIASDGQALILNLAQSVPWTAETRVQDMVVNFGQTIPKPFCSSGPADFVYAQGPVHLVQTVDLDESGYYLMSFKALGNLSVLPVNPFTGEPSGDPLKAYVMEMHKGKLSDSHASAWSVQYQKLYPWENAGAGRLFRMLKIGSYGAGYAWDDIICSEALYASE